MDFKDIQNVQMLSEFLGIDREFLEMFLITKPLVSETTDSKEIRDNSWYARIRLQKRNRNFGHRVVYDVRKKDILDAHKNLQSRLNKLYKVPDCVHGFVHGKSISSNASFHLAKKIVLKLDIKNFFESITANQVAVVFQRLGCNKDISEAIARLVTIDGKLAQGLVTSPVIANMAVSSLDEKLNAFCLERVFDYTRYADDITISSNTTTPEIEAIESIISPYGFRLNHNKTQIMLRGKRQYVTGLTVFDERCPRISKRTKRNLRLEVYYQKLYGMRDVALHKMGISRKIYENDNDTRSLVDAIAAGAFRNLKGRIDFVNAVEPLFARELYNDLFEGQKSD